MCVFKRLLQCLGAAQFVDIKIPNVFRNMHSNDQSYTLLARKTRSFYWKRPNGILQTLLRQGKSSFLTISTVYMLFLYGSCTNCFWDCCHIARQSLKMLVLHDFFSLESLWLGLARPLIMRRSWTVSDRTNTDVTTSRKFGYAGGASMEKIISHVWKLTFWKFTSAVSLIVQLLTAQQSVW